MEECTPCDCPEGTYCVDGRDGDGSCLGQKLVDCRDVAPSNATSIVEQVTITYTDAGGWSEPAACSWTCDTDWVREGEQCIHTRLEACTDVSPENAVPVFELVETTYTTEGGWSAPAPCAWTCLPGYRESGSACVTTPTVVSATPEDGGIAPEGVVTLVFSESMDTAAVERAITVTPSMDLVFTWSDAAKQVAILRG